VTRRPLDAELVRRGLVASTEEARSAIAGHRVLVRGAPIDSAGSLVAPGDSLDVLPDGRRYVSRGGEKLAAALDRFSIDPTGRDCLDAGASTGGFTDCLLQRGASRVLAVDVGYGQLAWKLRTDPRITVLERTNVRRLEETALPFRPSLVVADLSFVSLRSVVGSLARLAAPGGDLVLLVKPQFEAAPADVESGGLVREPDVWRRAMEGVASACRESGLAPAAAMASPLLGPAGNVEFLLHVFADDHAETLDGETAIQEGSALAAGRLHPGVT
jgi:23S rRNA (cytidine1920-2'-O)/16S rRNA (cytidine1409-2'-O)-methyltransferase